MVILDKYQGVKQRRAWLLLGWVTTSAILSLQAVRLPGHWWWFGRVEVHCHFSKSSMMSLHKIGLRNRWKHIRDAGVEVHCHFSKSSMMSLYKIGLRNREYRAAP
ncbi:hypothetical protein J6590_020993 [Homalodisca vitripennis]|nr:hypothetical protein J6590_020993 [Homalodisca vitripennis]